MVTGYPGRTNRHQTASEMHHDVEWSHPRYVAKARQRMAALEQLKKAGGETGIKATVARQGMQNGLEKYEGILEGIPKYGMVRCQGRAEKESAPGPRRRVAQALRRRARRARGPDAAKRAQEAEAETWNDVTRGSGLLTQALNLLTWSDEQQKKDADRKPGYQERDRSLVVGQQKAFAKRYDPTIDRDAVEADPDPRCRGPGVEELARPAARRAGRSHVDEATIDKALDRLYARTKLDDETERLKLLAATPAQLGARRIRSSRPRWNSIRASRRREAPGRREGELILLLSTYIDGLLASSAASSRPTRTARCASPTARCAASSRLRTSRPTRRSPPLPRSWPRTPARSRSTRPRSCSTRSRRRSAARTPARQGAVPVDFLSDLDITGGNSGSPVLNDKGELVGLAFDGNNEGLASDVVFNGETTRTIPVDVRYMLWVADAVDQADHVVRELGLEPAL